MHIFDLKIEALLFLSAMSRARASRDLNKLFLSNWVVCWRFGLFVRILVCLPEFWFVFHLSKNLETIFFIKLV